MRRLSPLAFLFAFLLSGCSILADLLSTDNTIVASCLGDDTVVVDGRDLCDEYEKFGKVDCVVGYRIRLNGELVCPAGGE